MERDSTSADCFILRLPMDVVINQSLAGLEHVQPGPQIPDGANWSIMYGKV